MKLLLKICAVILFALVILTNNYCKKVHGQIMEDDDIYYLPSSSWLTFFSIGYNETVADLVWIKSVLYFGKIADTNWEYGNGRGKFNYTTNYILTASELDPYFYALYKAGAVISLYHRGNITYETVNTAIKILEKGIKYFPGDGKLTFNLGFYHYFEMDRFFKENRSSPEWKKHKSTGLELIRRASFMENAPPGTTLLVSSLMEKDDNVLDDIFIMHLRDALTKETDTVIKNSLEWQLEIALGKAAIRDIKSARKMQNKWKTTMYFVPYELFLFLDSIPEADSREIIDPLYRTNQVLGLDEKTIQSLKEGDSTSSSTAI